MSWTDSLSPEEKDLLDIATELREAREAAELAMKRGSRAEMEHALARISAANARAKARPKS